MKFVDDDDDDGYIRRCYGYHSLNGVVMFSVAPVCLSVCIYYNTKALTSKVHFWSAGNTRQVFI